MFCVILPSYETLRYKQRKVDGEIQRVLDSTTDRCNISEALVNPSKAAVT
uniref:Uncharacterized protein n=1 Tax=Arion vulgaris TaxID=1028688 RepID=A0A0B7BM51_9EUPU